MSVQYSIQRYIGDGSTRTFQLNFAGGYLDQADVKVYVLANNVQTLEDPIFNGPSTIVLDSAPPAGSIITIVRETEKRFPLVDFNDGAILDEASLDKLARQAIFVAAEVADQAGIANDNVANIFGRLTALEQNGVPAGGGGGGGGQSYFAPRYPLGGKHFAGITIDQDTGNIYDADLRDVWLDQFYTSETDTDTMAFQAYAIWATTAVTDSRLRLRAGCGRGPSGRYLVDSEIVFNAVNQRIVLDFGEATVRFTTPNSRFRYASAQPGSSGAALTNFFIVRGGVHQYSSTVDGPFYWDFKYIPSRSYGTGYAENIRLQPQDANNAAHQLMSAFRCKNTWHFRAINCHVIGRIVPGTNVVPGSTFIRQEQCCIVTVIDKCEVGELDTAFVPGQCPLLWANGVLSGGGMGRGKIIRQNGAVAYLGGSGGSLNGTSYAYSFYDESGTFTNGACDVVDGAGVVTGTFTISGLTRVTQISEAMQVAGGSTFVGVNYFANAAVASNAIAKFLNWCFHDVHCAYRQGFLKLDGVADLQAGVGTLLIGMEGGRIAFDLNHGDLINIHGINATTDGRGGVFFKARNITNGQMSGNGINYYGTPWDIDNTVKSFTIADNTGFELGQTFTGLSTAKRFNATNLRGVRFKNNGLMGIGFDTDDNRRLPWNPTFTCSSGALGGAQVVFGYYTITNGVMHFALKANITRGTASGSLFVSAPTLPDVDGPTNIDADFSCHASVGFEPTVAIYSQASGLFQIFNGSPSNTTGNAFAVKDIPNNYSYFITGSVPVAYD